jgi:glycosyltransferase involved in cell wall biosynthesis
MPCLNEEKTIGICIKKIKDVFRKENISGEVIVVDNGSTDRSAQIAKELSCRVIFEEQKGYGAAYLKGISYARGKYIIIADSDNTYDFLDIPLFLKPLQEGYDFVIGSRFKGKIHKGAMPFLNRYVGNPILSFLCRLFFRTKLSDIHCGMRGFTKNAYLKMDLRTLGMEFATEMVVAALQNNLKIKEVPIEYHPRLGKSKLVPFRDAWRHIRFMLLYCPMWLYFVPGIFGFIIGFGLLCISQKGPFRLFGRIWDVHLSIFSSALCILSYQVINLGIYAHSFASQMGLLKEDGLNKFVKRHFKLEKGILLGILLFLIGLTVNSLIVIEWVYKHFGELHRIREATLGLTLLVLGLQTIFSSFFISLLFLKRR